MARRNPHVTKLTAEALRRKRHLERQRREATKVPNTVQGIRQWWKEREA